MFINYILDQLLSLDIGHAMDTGNTITVKDASVKGTRLTNH